MRGQWLGTYTGTSSGTIIVNADEREARFQGVAYLSNNDGSMPRIFASFRTEGKQQNFTLRTDSLSVIHPVTGDRMSWETVKAQYPDGTQMPQYADVTGSWNDTELKLSWVTDIGSSGACALPRTQAGKESELVPLQMDWNGYKDHVATLERRQYLFRGQNKPWRLRTSFHRTGRADLTRFLAEDIAALHRHLSARTKHVFNLAIGIENGAFFNLVQHHGYPTPLLDWSYSPYVAAFCAYRGISNQDAANAR